MNANQVPNPSLALQASMILAFIGGVDCDSKKKLPEPWKPEARARGWGSGSFFLESGYALNSG